MEQVQTMQYRAKNRVTEGCKISVATQYTDQRNIVAKIEHKETRKMLNLLQAKQPYYKYTPETT